MKGSLIIVLFFVIGIVLGLNFESLDVVAQGDWSKYVLYSLMFFVGISIGCDRNTLNTLRKQDIKVLLLPLCTIVGSLVAAMLVTPLLTGVSLKDGLAIASGFGYYSLSSIIITEARNVELGTIALMSNIIREIISLLAAPLIVRYFSPIALISSSGATSLDTLLPIITRFSGKEYVIISIFHGLVMELSVPVLVTLFVSI